MESLGARPRRARSHMTKPYPSSFMNQLVSAMTQLSSRLPSFPCRVLAYRESGPSGLCGSYVSLSGEKTEHIIGLLSHTLGWETLSRALDHDLPLTESRGLVEAACEINKIVAESLHRQHHQDGRAPVAQRAPIGALQLRLQALQQAERLETSQAIEIEPAQRLDQLHLAA